MGRGSEPGSTRPAAGDRAESSQRGGGGDAAGLPAGSPAEAGLLVRDALARHVAHDLNNLLTAVVSFSILALEGLEADSPVAGDLNHVLEAAERARHLSDALLPFSSAAPGAATTLRADERLRAAEPVLRALAGRRHELELRVEAGELGTSLGADELERLLVASVLLARESVDRACRLAIVLRPTDSGPELELGLGRHGETVGPALDAIDDLVRELPVGFRREDGAGGSVRLRFTLPPPAPDDPPDSESLAGPAAEPEPAPGRVLLVDDDPLILGPAGQALRSTGHEVTLVESAEAALALADEELARFEVVLSDVVLPGLNGAELARALRARTDAFALCFMTGERLSEAERRELEAHGPVMAKPFTPDELRRHVAEGLARARRGG